MLDAELGQARPSRATASAKEERGRRAGRQAKARGRFWLREKEKENWAGFGVGLKKKMGGKV